MASQLLNLYFKSSLNPLPIGQLSIEDTSREDSVCFFVYDSQWLECGYSLSRDLPLIAMVFQTDLAHPYFGFMHALLPGLGPRTATRFIYKNDFPHIQLLLLSHAVL